MKINCIVFRIPPTEMDGIVFNFGSVDVIPDQHNTIKLSKTLELFNPLSPDDSYYEMTYDRIAFANLVSDSECVEYLRITVKDVMNPDEKLSVLGLFKEDFDGMNTLCVDTIMQFEISENPKLAH